MNNASYHLAGIHHEWREAAHGLFDLSHPPPDSPDLNSCEQVWKLTRRLCMHDRFFPELTRLATTVATQFTAWARPNDMLRSLCAMSRDAVPSEPNGAHVGTQATTYYRRGRKGKQRQ